MKLKNIMFSVMLALAPFSAYAQSKTDTITIAAGMSGGGYDKFAKDMAVRLEQRGYTAVTVSNNNGSDAITLAACNAKADIAITQVDAIYARYQEGCVLTPVADYGTEYAFILFPPDSDNTKLKHLDESDSIAVDGLGSGTELFWKTIVSIDSSDEGNKADWAKAKAVESAPDQLTTMANFGDIQAAILVRKADSKDVVMLLEQGWKLGQLWDSAIDEQLFNNKPLYESVEPTVVYSAGKVSNYAYAVRSFIVVTKQHADNRPFKMDVSKSVN